jgi:signal transduction histidine kinase
MHSTTPKTGPISSREFFEDSDAFRILFEKAPVGVLFFDPDDDQVVMRIAACNPAAARMHGCQVEDLLGQSIRKIDPLFFIENGFDIFSVDDLIGLLKDPVNSRGIAHHQSQTGEPLFVEYRTLLLTMQGKRYIVGIEQDVSVREKQRAELVEAQQILVDAIEAIDDGVMIFDREGCLVAFNRQATELLPSIIDLVNDGDSYSAILKAYSENPTKSQNEQLVDGWLAATSAPGRSFAKNIPVTFLPNRYHRLSEWPTEDGGIVTVVTDVTELQMTFDRAEAASRSKTEFLNYISQELKTPLSGMLGLLDSLRATELDASQRYLLDLLTKSGRSFERVISDILDLSEIERNELKLYDSVTNIKAILDSVSVEYAEAAAEKHLRLSRTWSGEPDVEVRADTARFRDILAVLVDNAIKFTDRGEVEIVVSVGAIGNDIDLRIEVRDTGCGIDPAQHQSVFETFRLADMTLTRSKGGLGVGLAKAKALVGLMGGEIGLESDLGVGSTFWIRLRLPRIA